jgi:hypothetical protein
MMDGPNAVLPSVRFGERAFESLLARRMARQEEHSTWFERHGANPTPEPPVYWPEAYRPDLTKSGFSRHREAQV